MWPDQLLVTNRHLSCLFDALLVLDLCVCVCALLDLVTPVSGFVCADLVSGLPVSGFVCLSFCLFVCNLVTDFLSF